MGSARYEGGTTHLRFDEIPPEGLNKMPRYLVQNIVFHATIGEIHWRGGWRQYVFQAYPEIDMSRSCMKKVSDFIDAQMIKWRVQQKKRADNKQ